jgi:glutamine synthetase
LPASLPEAIEEFEKNRDWLESVFGENYVQWFLWCKKAEIKAVTAMDVPERRLLMINHF